MPCVRPRPFQHQARLAAAPVPVIVSRRLSPRTLVEFEPARAQEARWLAAGNHMLSVVIHYDHHMATSVDTRRTTADIPSAIDEATDVPVDLRWRRHRIDLPKRLSAPT